MDVDAVVIGGGVVGLAIAAELAPLAPNVVLLERHDRFGQETSSRNSEVIHAGLYHPAGWLKSRLCVEGRRSVEAMARLGAFGYRKCGKVVIAVADDEIASLERLREQGEANGVEGLRFLTRDELREREPDVSARAALLSPETAIVDSHGLVEALRSLASERGAALVVGAEVVGVERSRGAWRLRVVQRAEQEVVTTRAVVNSGGLGAQSIMRLAGLDPSALGAPLHLCKGEYFAIRGACARRVNGLVYPSPTADLAGLGVHTVVDLAGGVKLGPDATYVDAIDYAVDPRHAARFLASARPYLPFLGEGDLAPAMAGVRPKLSGAGEAARDFHIAHEADHGAPGFFNLAGIESPGLTASPAIGRMVARMVAGWLRDG